MYWMGNAYKDRIASLPTASTWTYLEVAMAITCGNLPLLAPLFGSIFRRGSTLPTSRYASNDKSDAARRGFSGSLSTPHNNRHSVVYPEEILLEAQSNEALNSPYNIQPRPQSSDSNRILVEDEIIVSYTEGSHTIPSIKNNTDKNKDLPPLPPPPSYASRAWAQP